MKPRIEVRLIKAHQKISEYGYTCHYSDDCKSVTVSFGVTLAAESFLYQHDAEEIISKLPHNYNVVAEGYKVVFHNNKNQYE